VTGTGGLGRRAILKPSETVILDARDESARTMTDIACIRRATKEILPNSKERQTSWPGVPPAVNLDSVP